MSMAEILNCIYFWRGSVYADAKEAYALSGHEIQLILRAFILRFKILFSRKFMLWHADEN